MNIYTLWSSNLLEIAINNNIFNQYLIEPFLILLRINLTKTHPTEQGYKLMKQVKLFGKYNFNEIIKNNEISSLAIESYFIILKLLPEHMNHILRKFNPPSIPLTLTKAKDDPNILKSFNILYYDMNKITDKPSNKNYSLFYRPDMISTCINSYVTRMNKYIDPNALIYSISEYHYHPSSNTKVDKLKDYYFNSFETILDYMITLINYNMVSISNVEEFFQILNKMDENNFYEKHFQELLLNNIKFYEKLLTVVNFILNPHLYFYNNLKIEKIENITDYLVAKYKIDNFKKLDEDVEKKLFEEFHQVETEKFTMSINALEKNIMSEILEKVNVEKTIVSKKSNIF